MTEHFFEVTCFEESEERTKDLVQSGNTIQTPKWMDRTQLSLLRLHEVLFISLLRTLLQHATAIHDHFIFSLSSILDYILRHFTCE